MSYLDEIRDLQNNWGRKDYFDIKTSGSTGVPKIIRHSRRAICSSAALTIKRFDLRANDSFLVCLPIRFIAGMMMVIRSEIVGGRIVAIEPSTNPLAALNESIDFAALTPLQFERAIEHNPEKIKLIKTIILGGAPISYKLNEKIKAIHINQTSIFHTYGMTETITHVAVRHLNGPAKSDQFRALEGVLFDITSDDGLMISADHLDQKTLVTNDLVELIDNQHFVWKGRLDHVINTGGVKVLPFDLEQLIRPHVQQEFFISHLKDPSLGQKIVLVIEDPLREVDTIQLRFQLKERLPKNQAPREIYCVPEILKTPTGKAKKNLSEYDIFS